MHELSQESVADLASAALESMAFMLLDVVESPGDAEACFHARIRFDNEEEDSELFLSASEGFVAELASSMLGMEPEEVVPAEEGVQALRELTNVLAGEVTRVLGAELRPASVGLPESVAEVPEPAAGTEHVECVLDSMGDILRVCLHRGPRGEG